MMLSQKLIDNKAVAIGTTHYVSSDKETRQERYASLVPQVCEILNVESSKDWRILHRDGDHVLVHFVDSQRTNML